MDDANGDLDNDNLTNYEEYQYGLNPANIDSDGDNMPDAWEIMNHLNPLLDDASLDSDGDGKTNYEEYLEGTNPFAAPQAEAIPVDFLTPLLLLLGGVGIGAVVIYALMRKRIVGDVSEVVPTE